MSFEPIVPRLCTSNLLDQFEDVEMEDGEKSLGGVDAFSSKEAKSTAYSIIHEEIGHIQTKIRKLHDLISKYTSSIIHWKTRQNALSSCFKLPDEIYVEIWKYLAHDASNLSTSWVRVAHVCSHWRRLALKTPALWTWPCIRRPSIAAQMLKRAGGMDLALILDLRAVVWLSSVRKSSEIEPAQKLAKEVLSRACVFIGDFSQDTILNFRGHCPSSFLKVGLADVNISRATKLEYIEITFPQPPYFRGQDIINHEFLDFIQHSPNLKQVLLNGTSLFLARDETVFTRNVQSGLTVTPRHITALRVSFTWIPDARWIAPVRQILQTLRHLPHLTTLTLENIFKEVHNEDIAWCAALPHSISFEQLQRITLTGETQALSLFLDAVSFHQQSHMRVFGTTLRHSLYDTELLDYDQAVSQMIRTVTHRISPFINYVKLSFGRKPMEWYLLFNHYSGNKTSASVELAVEAEPTLISASIPTWPLDDLSKLVYELPFSDLTVWRSFGALQNLRSISVNLRTHPAFLRTLALLRDSLDTVFDWPPDLKLLASMACPKCSNSLLHFPNMTDVRQPVARRTSKLKHLETLASKEELQRVWSARFYWKSALRCRCIPRKS